MRTWRFVGASLIAAVLLVPPLGPSEILAQGVPAFYYLPAPAGTELLVNQGTYPDGSHQGAKTEAFDLILRTGEDFPVVAARAGTIIAARHDVPEGQCPYADQPTAPACWSEVDHVLVDHGDGTSALYLHLAPADPPVSVGQVVETGTPLRTAGSSGWSSGVHLHFQVQDTPSAATLAQPGGFLGTAFPVAFADPDVLAKAPDGHLVEGTTYVSGDPGTGTGPSGVAPAVQWLEPLDGAKVGPSLRLVAWPTPVLDGGLTDLTDVARVDFGAVWSRGAAPLCSATSADAEGRWSCTADLLARGVPAGPLELAFAVLRTDGSVLRAPDGGETVRFVMPPTDPARYLRAGIPPAVRETCRKRTTELPPGTIAAVDCYPESPIIDAMAYFLLRPDDARAVWNERIAEYGLQPGGDCVKGKQGIESRSRRLSVGCYQNEYGYANLRLVSSAECPSVYWSALGTKRDIAGLWKAYEGVAGEGWADPGLAGRKDAPGCRGPIPEVAPPGAPGDVTARTETSETGLAVDQRQACVRADIPVDWPRSWACHAARSPTSHGPQLGDRRSLATASCRTSARACVHGVAVAAIRTRWMSSPRSGLRRARIDGSPRTATAPVDRAVACA